MNYRCFHCLASFDSKEELRRHKGLLHSTEVSDPGDSNLGVGLSFSSEDNSSAWSVSDTDNDTYSGGGGGDSGGGDASDSWGDSGGDASDSWGD